jgi:acyl-CoA thioester hydrolase
LVLDQSVLRGVLTLFTARVTLVCLTAAGTPTRFPAAMRAALTGQG